VAPTSATQSLLLPLGVLDMMSPGSQDLGKGWVSLFSEQQGMSDPPCVQTRGSRSSKPRPSPGPQEGSLASKPGPQISGSRATLLSQRPSLLGFQDSVSPEYQWTVQRLHSCRGEPDTMAQRWLRRCLHKAGPGSFMDPSSH
jgi:hypothetical protein